MAVTTLAPEFIEEKLGTQEFPEILKSTPGVYATKQGGTLTINVLSCVDSVIIPVQAAYLPVKGLEQLIKIISKVKRHLNLKIEIEGILITMVDGRTNYAKDITTMLREAYGRNIKIFENHIPMSVRAQEASTQGMSIFRHDPKGKVAQAYQTLTEEVIGSEKWCKQY